MSNLPIITSYRNVLLSARRRRRLRSVSIAVLAFTSVGIGVAAAAGTFDGPADRASLDIAVSKNGALSGDRDALARSYGIDPAAAHPAFTDGFGRTVSVGTSSQGSCLLIDAYGDICRTPSQIAAGQGMLVVANCSSDAGASRLMQTFGLVPTTTTEVRVRYSDGSHVSATTIRGAFVIKGTVPSPRDSYPTTIEWIDAAGNSLSTNPFPVDGQRVCIQVSPDPTPQ